MPSLKEQEERLRFLVNRVDSEIQKFEGMARDLEHKRNQLNAAIADKGLRGVSVNVSPHGPDQKDLYAELQQHVAELHRLKNAVSARLHLVVKEEELLAALKGKYGESVDFRRFGNEGFEVEFHDNETEYVHKNIASSRKLLEQLRQELQ